MKELAPAEGLTKLHSYLHRWALKADGLPFHTHACWLLPVRYHGELAMLKIATEDEERRGAFLMRWWDGVGAVRALAHEGDALLLERASGDRSLIDMARTGQDDEASRIMCQVAASLHTPRTGAKPELIPCPDGLNRCDRWLKRMRVCLSKRLSLRRGCLLRKARSSCCTVTSITETFWMPGHEAGWPSILKDSKASEPSISPIFSAIPTRALPRHPAASRGKSR